MNTIQPTDSKAQARKKLALIIYPWAIFFTLGGFALIFNIDGAATYFGLDHGSTGKIIGGALIASGLMDFLMVPFLTRKNKEKGTSISDGL